MLAEGNESALYISVKRASGLLSPSSSRQDSQDERESPMDDIVDEIRKEMMVIMLDSVQRAADLCADLCVDRMSKQFETQQAATKQACKVFDMSLGDGAETSRDACSSRRPSIEKGFDDMQFFKQPEEDENGFAAEPAAEPAEEPDQEEPCGRSSRISNDLLSAADRGFNGGIEVGQRQSSVDLKVVQHGMSSSSHRQDVHSSAHPGTSSQSSSYAEIAAMQNDLRLASALDKSLQARQSFESVPKYRAVDVGNHLSFQRHSAVDIGSASQPGRPSTLRRHSDILHERSSQSSQQRPHMPPLDLKRQSGVGDLLDLAKAAASHEECSSSEGYSSEEGEDLSELPQMKEDARYIGMAEVASLFSSQGKGSKGDGRRLSAQERRTLLAKAAQENDLIRDLMAVSMGLHPKKQKRKGHKGSTEGLAQARKRPSFNKEATTSSSSDKGSSDTEETGTSTVQNLVGWLTG